MQIVIEISEGIMEYVQNNDCLAVCFADEIAKAIKNGTQLPAGHGDLIDRTKIGKPIPAEEDNCTGMGMTYDEMYAYNDGIESMYDLVQGAKPIIGADKE